MKHLLTVFLMVMSSFALGAPMSTKYQTAYLAGGCFWGVEDLIRKQPGVVSTDVGYAGGKTNNPTYAEVKLGSSGHAEAVKIEFDPAKTSYEKILTYFFRIHDPTTVNRQGNDVGTQYRSAIFFADSEQESVARKVIKDVNASKRWKSPVSTVLQPFKEFTLAESYHQDYLVKNPQGYTCHWERP
ncbi:MAG: peptide-methionine (S)-S-oxide reductase MsrA [Bdellovibrionota bacterium]